jgi:uncharacterized protein YecE (DUF72 family)
MTIDSSDNRNLVRFGTSSFSSSDWIGPFYPQGTTAAAFLQFYARQFDTIEVDSTYYAIPSSATVQGWARKTPEDFVVAVKFPRAIVHGGDDAKPNSDLILDPDKTYLIRDRFLEVMSKLGQRLGPLVLQFPFFSKKAFNSAEPFLARLDRFLSDLPAGFRYGVEIRNRQWLTADYAALLRRHNVALVLVDQAWMPHGDEVEKLFDPVTTDFTYIRLLGDHKQIEAITQSWDKEVIDRSENLSRWSAFLLRLALRGVKTFVYVNNHYAGHAPTTTRRLKELYDLAWQRRLSL